MNTIRLLVSEDVIFSDVERQTKYFVTMDCIRANTCRAHISFHMIVLNGCNFVNGCDFGILQMSCLASVFRACYYHFWTRNNTYVILEPWYELHIRGNIWSYIVKYIVMGLCLLPDRLAAQQYRNLLKVVLPDLLAQVPLNVTASLNTTNPLQERGLTWVTDWMVSSVTWSKTACFLSSGHHRSHISAVLVTTIEDMTVGIQASMAAVDSNITRRYVR
jgi:hypothetical protein